MTAQQIFYEGKVQGVGFRYYVKELARGFDVSGWVRNLPDGRVELQISGADEEVTDFLKAIRDSQLKGHIKKEQIHPIAHFSSKGFAILP